MPFRVLAEDCMAAMKPRFVLTVVLAWADTPEAALQDLLGLKMGCPSRVHTSTLDGTFRALEFGTWDEAASL